MIPSEAVPVVFNFDSVTPIVVVAIVAVIGLCLSIFCVFMAVTFMKTLDRLVVQHEDLAKSTAEVIESNTQALKSLDETIKDRFLRYLEGEIGKNAK